eukprot:TRINITY_DN9242_c0_g1_i2.p1 TRINITY_DN9242_c0_g1~~TRINITY_DN9242_c0_g1_i2.p1  ORF type:complete len:905 (-),score=147.60 TRINITY_DN9242_c0_g1_i2:2079-4760(-)
MTESHAIFDDDSIQYGTGTYSIQLDGILKRSRSRKFPRFAKWPKWAKILLVTGLLLVASIIVVAIVLTRPGIPNYRLPTTTIPVSYDLSLDVSLAQFMFSGKVNITVDITEPVSQIVLHVGSTLSISNATLYTTGGNACSGSGTLYDANLEFFTLLLSAPVVPGRYFFVLDFSGAIMAAKTSAGFFRDYFTDSQNITRWLAVTSFEPAFARRAFPCFDEPALKAFFSIRMSCEAGYQIVANTPIMQQHLTSDGRYSATFQPTPRMSTYALSWAVHDLANITAVAANGIPVTIYTRTEYIVLVEYALQFACQALVAFEQFVGVPFPMQKLDIVVTPHYLYQATEGWGMMLFSEASILYDELLCTDIQKQTAVTLIAYEIAHQWFGDLVTMDWWDNIWLNEGFATLLQYYIVDLIHPDWVMHDQFVVLSQANAFTRDAMLSSHPLHLTNIDPKNLFSLFDAISYDKGASVLRMFAAYIGKEQFWQGVLQSYLRRNMYSVVNDSTLVHALQEQTALPFVEMSHAWIRQMNFPVVQLIPSKGEIDYLTAAQQERFTWTGGLLPTEAQLLYYVPFTYRLQQNGSQVFTDPLPLQNTAEELIPLVYGQQCQQQGWIMGNPANTGFYYTLYTTPFHQCLRLLLNTSDFGGLTASDRAGILQSTFGVLRAGDFQDTVATLRGRDGVKMLSYLWRERDYVPWKQARTSIDLLTHLMDDVNRPTLDIYICKLITPVLNDIGFEDSGNHTLRMMRADILAMAAAHRCAATVGWALQLFAAFMKDPLANRIPPNLKQSILSVGVLYGWDPIRKWIFHESCEQLQCPANRGSTTMSSSHCQNIRSHHSQRMIATVLKPNVIQNRSDQLADIDVQCGTVDIVHQMCQQVNGCSCLFPRNIITLTPQI